MRLAPLHIVLTYSRTKVSPQGKQSASHNLINPLCLYAVDAPIRDLPATLPYRYTVAVLEWKAGRVTVLSSIAWLEASIFHYSCFSDFLVYL
jgi:hypothetical protein